MGVYYADGGKWAFNHIGTYFRMWDVETKEYKGEKTLELLDLRVFDEIETKTRPSWDHKIKMFDGWLALGWESGDGGYYYDDYERVDNTPVDTEHEEEHAEADPLTGDSISEAARWRGQADLAALAGENVGLRFHLYKAKLFSVSI